MPRVRKVVKKISLKTKKNTLGSMAKVANRYKRNLRKMHPKWTEQRLDMEVAMVLGK